MGEVIAAAAITSVKLGFERLRTARGGRMTRVRWEGEVMVVPRDLTA